MKLIVGLGNVGDKYKGTRHNVGCLVVDELAEKISKYSNKEINKWEKSNKFSCYLLHTANYILAKPTTFMNDSGNAVSKLTSYFKLPTSNLYVIHDDLDIKLGDYKIQLGKGPKEHNGLNSIYEKIGTQDFWHVRIGIDNRDPENRTNGEEYVLQKFTDEEKNKLNEVIGKIIYDLQDKLKN